MCECVGRGGTLSPSTAIMIDNNKQINELNKEELVDGGKQGRKSDEVRIGVDIQLYILFIRPHKLIAVRPSLPSPGTAGVFPFCAASATFSRAPRTTVRLKELNISHS